MTDDKELRKSESKAERLRRIAKKRLGKRRADLTDAKIKLMAKTGMMPLDFLCAAYRNQLYEAYDMKIDEQGTTYFTPRKDARHILLKADQRLTAARAAAPYMHRKMPIGIEDVTRKPFEVTPEKMAGLSKDELELLVKLLDRLGVGTETPGVQLMDHTAAALEEDREDNDE